ncbi:S41 family peptidase [Sphingomonas prati]|uniref:Carboxyl-terminal processing protease n=1 Tax=Sphingomonas prati TaxID=1843237 RepID=A0A7W9BPV2_9SPHN|nr:S41 family peptidase [Sphingomonas prati]MBB5727918.1 carboxyl-terminal processing protease [Sphingomonas prati]GGE81860.1 hypothetical protein GCM10011404_13110 [Sphingomonas prati]
MTPVDSGSSIVTKRRVGFLGWVLRGLATLLFLLVLGSASLVAYFTFVVSPRQQAEQEKAKHDAAIFANLSGSTRRLAIFDAFVDRINAHYYDQRFSGFDWKALTRFWREKAATAHSDFDLYFGVLFPLTQRFPVSHVNVEMPDRHTARARPSKALDMPLLKPAFCGDFADTGMQIVPIRRPMPIYIVGEVALNSPAARAGVTPGWIIRSFTQRPHANGGEIEAQLVKVSPSQMHEFETMEPNKSSASGSSKSRQPANLKPTSIRLTYACGSGNSGFSTHRISSGPLYIRFDQFLPVEIDKVKEAVRSADRRGVVLDLRYNTGGYSLLLLNALMGRGQPVYRTRNASGLTVVKTDYWTNRYDGPLAVLVGPASASAAEISAAVLKQSRRGIVIGRMTNGSVLGALSYPLPDGGSVQVPVEDVEMLDGKRLEGRGVLPDVEVYPTIEQIRAGRDAAIDEAVRELRKSGSDR